MNPRPFWSFASGSKFRALGRVQRGIVPESRDGAYLVRTSPDRVLVYKLIEEHPFEVCASCGHRRMRHHPDPIDSSCGNGHCDECTCPIYQPGTY